MKLAIFGFGKIGGKHLRAIQAVSNMEVVAIIESNAPVDIPEGIQWFKSIDLFFEQDNDVVCVSICTPNGLHAEHAEMCIRNNYHVLVEKPLALSEAEGIKLLALAEEMKKRIFCVMQLRYSPVAQYVKTLVEQNLFGDIFSVEVRCFWNRGRAYYGGPEKENHWHGSKALDGGPLFTQFSHFIDFIYWLFGRWSIQHVNMKNVVHEGVIDFEDFGTITFSQGDISGTMTYTTASYEKNYESSVTILGSNGMISIGGQYFDEVKVCRGENLPNLADEDIIAYKANRDIGHIQVYREIYNAWKSGAEPIITANDGVEVVGMIEEVYNRK